jgi:hypothetical protein
MRLNHKLSEFVYWPRSQLTVDDKHVGRPSSGIWYSKVCYASQRMQDRYDPLDRRFWLICDQQLTDMVCSLSGRHGVSVGAKTGLFDRLPGQRTPASLSSDRAHVKLVQATPT